MASATVAARLGLACDVYMGEEDVHRQSLNVYRMKLLGAQVISVTSGSRTLKDAMNEAMRDWVTNVRDTHYLIGSAIGPHPFPTIVRDFQAIIGMEAREQYMDMNDGNLPDAVVACVGGGSNAIGMFTAFLPDTHPSKESKAAAPTRVARGPDRKIPACGALSGVGSPAALSGRLRRSCKGADSWCSLLALLACSMRRHLSFARVISQQTCCCAADRLAARLSFDFCFLLVVARHAVCHNI